MFYLEIYVIVALFAGCIGFFVCDDDPDISKNKWWPHDQVPRWFVILLFILFWPVVAAAVVYDVYKRLMR